jgi:hypothetical protein
MNCARYQAQIEGSSLDVFEQICFVILDICQKNQTSVFENSDIGLEKLFGLTQPVFASIQHTCSGGLEQSAQISTLFMVNELCFKPTVPMCTDCFAESGVRSRSFSLATKFEK